MEPELAENIALPADVAAGVGGHGGVGVAAAQGDRIGPYRIVGRLGAGGMGQVLLGRAEDGTLAAVKTIRPELLDNPDVGNRFRREIEALRTVESPWVARLLGGSADAEVPWLASEFVAGPTLDRAVAGCGPLPVAVVAGIGVRLAAALSDVHGKGLLHRDLKPGNVLLSATGPKLIDFGIARAADEETAVSGGTMLGSLGYMAPEQVLDAGHAVSASDVFSLGAVLVYAATGRGPFGEAEPAVLLHRTARAETELGAVPVELHGIVAACLLREPADRPTPAELAQALQCPDPATGWPAEITRMIAESSASAQAAALAPPPRPTNAAASTGAGRPARRRSPLVIAAASAFVLAAAGTAAVLHFGVGSGSPADGQPTPSVAATKAPPAAATLTGVTEQGGPGHNAVFTTAQTRPPSGFHPWAAYLADQPTGCSLGAGTLVCRLVDGSLQALDTATGHERWRVDLPKDPGAPDQPTTNNGLRLIPEDGDDPAINGNRVASRDADGALRVQDLTGGRVLSTTPFGKDVGLATEPLADGDRLLLSLCHRGEEIGCEFTLDASTFDGGQPTWSRPLGRNGPTTVKLHLRYGPVAGDGHTVYAATSDGLASFDEDTGAPIATMPGACGPLAVTGTTVLCRTADGGLVTAGARDFAGSKDISGDNQRLHDQKTVITATDGTVITAQNASDGSMSAIDAATGAQRWRLAVDKPRGGDSTVYPTTARPILLGTKAVTMTDARLLIVPANPEGAAPAPTTVDLAKPAGSPGPHATLSSFAEYGHPRVLALDGILIAVGADGAVHAVEAPQ
ncbi:MULTISPECIES: protein kinase [unclassified Kitasatospora]|uniref:protein kinase domain-containing protein n=1 Tax=unclassified Kitasatospora TaxID=2633591 RepID=UPI0033CA488F